MTVCIITAEMDSDFNALQLAKFTRPTSLNLLR